VKRGQLFPLLGVSAAEGGNGGEGPGEEEEADGFDVPGVGVGDGELDATDTVGGTEGEEEGVLGGSLQGFKAFEGGETVGGGGGGGGGGRGREGGTEARTGEAGGWLEVAGEGGLLWVGAFEGGVERGRGMVG
jgi:hypothetical protein